MHSSSNVSLYYIYALLGEFVDMVMGPTPKN